MEIDSRFNLELEDRDGQKALVFKTKADVTMEEDAPVLAVFRFDELCDLVSMTPASRTAFRDRRSVCIFSNGWQSWSFGGELAQGEKVRRARFITALNAYTDRPGPLCGAKEILSNFLTWFRVGERRLSLVSRGEPDRPPLCAGRSASPPISFRIDRGSYDVTVEALARGARFSPGETVAELRLFFREGYFQAKDAVRQVFREYRHFERLVFLGHGGSLVPGGYESWYNHYRQIDEAMILADLESISTNPNLINEYYLKRGKPTVFQIDDGWETAVGEWKCDSTKFPRGMKALAREIEARGMIPGLWLAPLVVTRTSAAWRERQEWILRDKKGRPVTAGWNNTWDGTFYCLDISLAPVRDYVAGLLEEVVEAWGYRYLKLDFLYAGMLEGERRGGGAAYEHYDALMNRITSRQRDSRGRNVAWLGCGAPFEPSFAHFPLMRIGTDTRESWERADARFLHHQGRTAAYLNLTHTIGRAILDGTVFVSDPDVVFCRTRGLSLGWKEKELIALVDFMLASQIMFSDDTHEFDYGEEGKFTSHIVGLYDRLAGREYGAERASKDVYRLFSKDGRVKGFANLSGRPFIDAVRKYDLKTALVFHAERKGDSLAFEPHSLSLFEG